ncbi:O-antigen ligase family protein [Flavobacterium sp. UBA4197]|nr:O-antigen ligase family protein [Flavobacterium sp. UBA4197]
MYEFWGINDHPIYISSYFAIALFFLLYSNVTSKTISYILFLVIFAGLLILSRKGSIIAFLVCTTIFFLSQKMKGYWLKGILIIMFVFIGMIFIPEIKNRFFELLSVDRIVENTETSTGIRYIIWKSSIQLVENAAFFGYGIGDVQDVLNESYIAQGYKKLAVDTYNAHNQYIQIALTAGLTGLLIFLASNIILYRQFIKSKNSQGLLVLTFFLMVFLTESYLERQNGIIMYSFIMSMYIFKEDEK